MNLSEVVVEGTLQADGTLQLDQKPNVSPGRVQIVLRPAAEPSSSEGWWPFMQRARREHEEAGAHFMNDEEMNAHLEWLREGDRFDDLLAQVDEARRQAESS